MAATPIVPNPALKPLEFLVGEWEMALSHAAFLPNPSDTVTSTVTFEWLENGAVLCMRMGDNATWLISRDESLPDYTVFYYDTRRVSRIYEMSLEENTWRIWRDSPTFSQRFTGKISGDSRTVVAQWEKSEDGIKWEHDFDVTYTKR